MGEIIWANRNPNTRKNREHLKKISASLFPAKVTKAGKPKKQWTNSNSFEAHGEIFWIVKKKPDGSASIFYHAYNVETRNHMVYRETKSEVMQELLDRYMDYMRDDY